jgi:hypothetical protein
MGAVSDDHGETFHQGIPKLKTGTVQNEVQIYWLATAGVITETPTAEHTCKTPKKRK